MKALVIHGKQDAHLTELPLPTPGAQEVRIRVAFVGICGSDLHYYYEGANGSFVVSQPLIPGHELSGTVDLDPSGTLQPGTPVTVHPAKFGHPEAGITGARYRHLWAGGSYLGSAATHPHTQGAMSQYLIVENSMVRQLPPDLPLATAALAEPLAVAIHGIKQLGGVAGEKVLVSGAGPIGLMASAAALASGAAQVVTTDVLAGPLARAIDLGVRRTVDVSAQSLPSNYFDMAIECSGAPVAVNGALAAVRKAGTIAQLGMMPAGPQPINMSLLLSKEITLVGCFRFVDEIDEAITMLQSHQQIATALTHVIDLANWEQAFAVARDSQASGKVLVKM